MTQPLIELREISAARKADVDAQMQADSMITTFIGLYMMDLPLCRNLTRLLDMNDVPSDGWLTETNSLGNTVRYIMLSSPNSDEPLGLVFEVDGYRLFRPLTHFTPDAPGGERVEAMIRSLWYEQQLP